MKATVNVMFPTFRELLNMLSPDDKEIAVANAQIRNGPPQWDLITATNPSPSTSGTSVEFTFSEGGEDFEDQPTHRQSVQMVLLGRGEDGLYKLKVVVRHPASSSLFIYLFAPSRRTGMLVDVNFIRHANTLQAGGAV